MPDAVNERAVIGGNNPPAPLTPEEITAYLADQYSTLTTKTDELAEEIKVCLAVLPTITNDEHFAQAGAVAAKARKYQKLIDARRKEAKEPFLEGGRAVDAWFKRAAAPLDAAAEIEARQTAYAREQDRKRREAAEAERQRQEAEAARLAAEAEQNPEALDAAIEASARADEAAAQAAAKPAERTRAYSDYGTVSSLRQRLDFEVTDKALVPHEFLVVDTAAVRRAITAGRRDIPGIRVFEDTRVVNR